MKCTQFETTWFSFLDHAKAPTVLIALTLAWPISSSVANEWMTWPSTYTHDPVTGQPVDQYAQAEQPLGPTPSAVQRSGYRHYRSTLQAGQSMDNFHVVEEWGQQVVPYEHWRFPYRPYGVPYGAWGPQAPYGIFNGQFGFGGGWQGPRPPGIPGPGYPGSGFPDQGPGRPGEVRPRVPAEWLPGTGRPPGSYPGQFFNPGIYGGRFPGGGGFGASRGFPLQPRYFNQPWYDGTYPDAPPLDQRPDAAFFYHPPLGRGEQPVVPSQ